MNAAANPGKKSTGDILAESGSKGSGGGYSSRSKEQTGNKGGIALPAPKK